MRQSEDARLRVDDLLVDLRRRTVIRGKQPIDLPDLSFKLLAVLIRHAPGGVDKDQLIGEVWGGAVVSDETLAQRVRLLRQALGEDSQNPRYVTAVRGRGYRLIPEVKTAFDARSGHLSRLMWPLIATAVLVGAVMLWGTDDATDDDLPIATAGTLAVLPFKDMSASRNHQFFADGMHEELLSRLALLDDVAVISRTSVEPYRGSGKSLPEIATNLRAEAVIEGSVRVDEDRLRITVQLIDGVTDEHLWAANYDRELSMQSIFTVQQEVAEQIAQALEVEYIEADRSGSKLPTESLDAYNLFLLGRYHTFRQTPDDLEQAVVYLEDAIALDDQFAEAYATLGWAYSFLGTEYGHRKPADVYPKAKEAALRAIALDAELADARTLYADILTWYDWDFEAAEREYIKTIEIDPLNILGYALFLSTQERHDEAIELIERRLAASSNDPYVQINAGWRYFHAGLYDKAAAAAETGSQHSDSATLSGWSYLAIGNYDRAIEAFQADIENQGRGSRQIANLASAYFRAGRNAGARTLLLELQEKAEQDYVAPSLFASVHFAAGDAEQGFAQLEKALQQRSRDMIFLQVSAMLRGHRNDPRYTALVEQVGFRRID